MPIYEQTYKPWEAQSTRAWRWRPIVAQDLRVAFSSRLVKGLILLASLPFLFFLFLFMAIDMMSSNPESLTGQILNETQFVSVNANLFWMYLRLCSPLVVLFCLAVGSGLICNDLRHNLLEIYFAKPLTSVDYFLGKLAAVLFFPLMITIPPAYFLFFLHILMMPDSSTEFMRENANLLWSMPAYAVVMTLPPATLAMLCSALSRSTRFAAVAFCAILFMSSALAEFVSEIVRRPNLALWGTGQSIDVIGGVLMQQEVTSRINWHYAIYTLTAWCLVAAALTFRRIRSVEVGS